MLDNRTKQVRDIAHSLTKNIVRRMGTDVIKSKRDKKKKAKLRREIQADVERYYLKNYLGDKYGKN